MLRYFDYRRRGGKPGRAGPGVEADAAPPAPETSASTRPFSQLPPPPPSEAAGPPAASVLGEAATPAAEAAAPALWPCPFAGLVACEEEQPAEFKAWARRFAKLFEDHCGPPPGIGVTQITELLLR